MNDFAQKFSLIRKLQNESVQEQANKIKSHEFILLTSFQFPFDTLLLYILYLCEILYDLLS